MPEEKNELQNNLFISWSGERSRYVAQELRTWLPMVLQASKPFMSKRDIDKGSRWHIELAKALEATKVGIICLTPENQTASWLLFEAGALSKTVDRGTRVCTYLLAGLKPQDVLAPLSEFQATQAEKEETRQLVHNVNVALGSPVQEQPLNGLFDLVWPTLKERLDSLPLPETAVPPRRQTADMIEEILNLNRAAAKSRESVAQLDRYIPTFELLMRALEPHLGSILAAATGVQQPVAQVTPANFIKLDGTIVEPESDQRKK